jgi:ATP-dependent Clp protease ATP-binding subunit ClpC
MFNSNGFTQKAINAINIAIAQASALGHTYIGSEHILLGLLHEGSGSAYHLLTLRGIRAEMITALLVGTVGRGIQSVLTPSDLTPCCKRILEESVSEARLLGLGSVGTEHILMALLKEKDSCAVRFIRELGADPSQLYKSLVEQISDELGDEAGGDKNKARAAGKTGRPQGVRRRW